MASNPFWVYWYFHIPMLTDWVVSVARFVTPGLVHPILLPPIAAFWLFVVRLVLFLSVAAAGLAPRAIAP
jgi:hypothetical protein